MPNSQSPIALERPAYNKLSYCEDGFKFSKPSFMASVVKDEIHNRLTSPLYFASFITQRWMSSPSCPASPQFITTSAFSNKLLTILNCFCMPELVTTLVSNFSGSMGKLFKSQLFQWGL